MGKKLVMQSPLVRLGIVCGRRCGGGFLSSRCRAPQGLKARSHGCTEVVLDWTVGSSFNPFHEEDYIVAWRRQEGADKDIQWTEQEVKENDRDDDTGTRWKFFM